MQITLELVKKQEKEILRNLLEKYLYEFSQYIDIGDGINDLGLFGYDYLDAYWNDSGRFPYFIKVDGKLAGFAMVSNVPTTEVEIDFKMSEFFVIYQYRKTGVAGYCAKCIFDMHKGKWSISFHPNNVASKKFWLKIVEKYTSGNYKQITKEQENSPSILLFDTKS